MVVYIYYFDTSSKKFPTCMLHSRFPTPLYNPTPSLNFCQVTALALKWWPQRLRRRRPDRSLSATWKQPLGWVSQYLLFARRPQPQRDSPAGPTHRAQPPPPPTNGIFIAWKICKVVQTERSLAQTNNACLAFTPFMPNRPVYAASTVPSINVQMH
jgi:hypothetical protein